MATPIVAGQFNVNVPTKNRPNKPIHANRHMRVVCIGAGASGLLMIYKLKNCFTDFTLNVYEKNPDIGGTWFENRYPGCACDIPAHNYVYSFEPNPDWSANYATSQEIFTYFNKFADKYGLRRYLKCSHEVIAADWAEDTNEWIVKIKTPDASVITERCDFLLNAAGILNAWRWPAIPGLNDYKGTLLHSAAWDETVDVAGRTVGLIGNGSSGIQILPQMQQKAKHVTTFIREPAWVSPTLGMEYHKYTEEERAQFRAKPEVLTELRRESEIAIGAVFPVTIQQSAAQMAGEAYIKQQMIEKLNNEELTSKLIPDFRFGCRRITPGINYLESLTKPNVTTVYGEIEAITSNGCRMQDGSEYPVDVLICATGFDTTFKPRFSLVGRGSANLAEEWKTEPRSYLGLAAAGFPNYFMFLGPNCPIANGPIIFSIELQAEYMARFMNRWQKENIAAFDPKREAIDDFIQQKDLYMQRSVWADKCQSWYKHPVTNKVTAVWPGSTLHYMEALSTPRYEDYNVKYTGSRFAFLGCGISQLELDANADRAYYIRTHDDGTSLFRDTMSTSNAKDASLLITGIAQKSLL